MTIQKLPQFIINQIAAGEVIERPSSVIKELIENSIDAHATDIHIKVINAGKSYISVYDNGDGITKEDLSNAVELHATSKMESLDLNNIESLGFRGEALASIASISNVSITSKTKDSIDTWKAVYEKNSVKELLPAVLNHGTKIEVKDLFFAIPARLNFLKTDQTEFLSIVNTCKHVMLPYHNVRLKLFNGEKLYSEYPATDQLKRILQIIGNDVEDDIIEIIYNSDTIKINGYIGKPSLNFKTQDKIYTYINGRYIKDKFLTFAIKNSYSNLIPHDKYPIVVLFLSLNTKDFDINVHPRKLEVRFRDIKKIQLEIEKAIKSLLVSISNLSSVYVSNNLSTYIKKTQCHHNTFNIEKPFQELNNKLIHGNANEEKKHNFLFEPTEKFEEDFIPEFTDTDNKKESIEKKIMFDNENKINFYSQESTSNQPHSKKLDLGNAVIQFMNKYIISRSSDNLFIIDQHAVHERLVFEDLKDKFYKNGIKSQQLLIHDTIKLSSSEIDTLLSHQEELANLGVHFHTTTEFKLVITALPAILINSNKSIFIRDIVAVYSSPEKNFIGNPIIEYTERVLSTFACHTSIRSGKTLSLEEMNQILRMIETNQNTAQCNHGRPSYIKLSSRELDKLFERI